MAYYAGSRQFPDSERFGRPMDGVTDGSEGQYNMANSVHVVPHGNGWAAVRPNAERASFVAPTQTQATRLATGLGKREGLEVVIHRTNGQIRDSNSYGNDPCPPRDGR
jgi:hypothetical protein